MKVPIIRIGNSKGIRLGKTVMEKYQFGDRIEMVMRENDILLKPVSSAREGWEKRFSQMHRAGDDELLMGDLFEEDDFSDEDDKSGEDPVS